MSLGSRTLGVVLVVSGAVVAAPALVQANQSMSGPNRSLSAALVDDTPYDKVLRLPPTGSYTPPVPFSTNSEPPLQVLTAAQITQGSNIIKNYHGVSFLQGATLTPTGLWVDPVTGSTLGEVATATLVAPLNGTFDLPVLDYSDDETSVTNDIVRYTMHNETQLDLTISFVANVPVMITPVDDSAVITATPLSS